MESTTKNHKNMVLSNNPVPLKAIIIIMSPIYDCSKLVAYPIFRHTKSPAAYPTFFTGQLEASAICRFGMQVGPRSVAGLQRFHFRIQDLPSSMENCQFILDLPIHKLWFSTKGYSLCIFDHFRCEAYQQTTKLSTNRSVASCNPHISS
jgi:hypothetical protein